MGRKYIVNGQEIDVEDAAAIQALSNEDFTDLLKQSMNTPDDGTAPRPQHLPGTMKPGTAFVVFPPKHDKDGE